MSEEKRDLLINDRELSAAIAAVEEINPDWKASAPEEPWISLKHLFARETVDRCHVDSMVLKKIALSMLNVMEKLALAGIRPGLYDMADIFCDMDSRNCRLMILHPDRFQLKDLEQDYEWYPEDERLLGDRTLFNEEDQLKADQRFLFRILCGSARGNVHFPPVQSDLDYAKLFYSILSDSLRERIESGYLFSYEELRDILQKEILMEEQMEQEAAVRLSVEPVLSGREEDMGEGSGRSVPVLLLVLDVDSSRKEVMARLLYNLQEKLDLKAALEGCRLRLCVVYGDEAVRVRSFVEYPPGFRFQYPAHGREYSAGEAMLVAADLISLEENRIRKEENGDDRVRVEILVNGRINNDALFKAGLQALKERGEDGTAFKVSCAGEGDGEAFMALKALEEQEMGRQNISLHEDWHHDMESVKEVPGQDL